MVIQDNVVKALNLQDNPGEVLQLALVSIQCTRGKSTPMYMQIVFVVVAALRGYRGYRIRPSFKTLDC